MASKTTKRVIVLTPNESAKVMTGASPSEVRDIVADSARVLADAQDSVGLSSAKPFPTKARRGRPPGIKKTATAAVIDGSTKTRAAYAKQIAEAEELAKQTSIRQNQLLEQNIAQTTITNDAAVASAPVVNAIAQLTKKIDAVSAKVDAEDAPPDNIEAEEEEAEDEFEDVDEGEGEEVDDEDEFYRRLALLLEEIDADSDKLFKGKPYAKSKITGRELNSRTTHFSEDTIIRQGAANSGKYQLNDVPIAIEDDQVTIKRDEGGDVVVPYTPGLRNLLFIPALTKKDLAEMFQALKQGLVKYDDVDSYLTLSMATDEDGEYGNSLKIQALLRWATEQASLKRPAPMQEVVEIKPEPPKRVAGKGVRGGNVDGEKPHVVSPSGKTYMYEADPNKQEIKIYSFRPDGSRAVKASKTIPMTDDLNILITAKRISANRIFSQEAIDDYRELVKHCPEMREGISKVSRKYAILNDTKLPPTKSKINNVGDVENNPIAIAESLFINIGLKEAGNTSDELQLTMAKQLKRLVQQKGITKAQAAKLSTRILS